MIKRGIAVAMVVGSVFGLVVCASAADFAADVVGQGEQGAMSGKMYVHGEGVRMEMAQAVTITRMDKKVVWILMPSEQMYMEQPLNPRDAVMSGAAKSGETERKSLGPDTVDGKQTEKFQVTYDYEGTRSSVYEWVEPSLGMPIKVAAVDGSWWMEYHNVKTGPQDASLFEVPSGYQKFAMPSMMR